MYVPLPIYNIKDDNGQTQLEWWLWRPFQSRVFVYVCLIVCVCDETNSTQSDETVLSWLGWTSFISWKQVCAEHMILFSDHITVIRSNIETIILA